MSNSLLVVEVMCHVKSEHVAAFRDATLVNARASVQEPGIARFDVLQDRDDATRFVLVEVYRSAEAPAANKPRDKPGIQSGFKDCNAVDGHHWREIPAMSATAAASTSEPSSPAARMMNNWTV